MAGRQLKELFRAFRTRDELAFRRAAAEIIEEEQTKHHHALARDLQKLLAAGGESVSTGATVILPEPPKDREGEWSLGEVMHTERLLDDLVLAKPVVDVLRGVADEVPRWPELDGAQVSRRQRLLFQGPPGCGKTSGAAALAAELGRPFLLVRLDAVVSSYLGETASNLRRILDYSTQAPFVVLFDEFDALGRSRDEAGDHGEMKRVVTAFLQMIDTYRGPSLLIAATNHPGLLDSALWRRFDEVISFGLPTVHELRRLVRLRLRLIAHPALDIEKIAARLRGLPHAAAEKFAEDARRAAILGGRREITEADADAALASVTSPALVGLALADHLLLPAPQTVGSRRFSGGGGAIGRDRSSHGRQLSGQLSEALTSASRAPRLITSGVDPNLVFKLHTSQRPAEGALEGRNLELLGETADYTYFVLSPDKGTALAQAIDRYRVSGDMSSLLDIVDSIELCGPEDRRGPGLDALDLSGLVQVDVKIWAAGNNAQAQTRARIVNRVLETLDGRVNLRSIAARRTILRVTLPGDAVDHLLATSVIEQVRTPPVPFLDFRDWWSTTAEQLERSDLPGETVGVLDDLPASEHPLLAGLIESVDLVGPADYMWQPPGHHGSEVVGRVLFPRLHEELRDLAPITAHGTVRVARILEADPNIPGRTRFATSAIPHDLVEQGIRLLHDRYGVRIFNLSVGYDEPYSDVHLGALTETIDDLVRELNIVVVVPTGNATFFAPAHTHSGHHVANDYPSYLDTPEHRIAEPGPAALAVTVGSIALSDAVADWDPPRLGWQPVAGVDRLSPFSRTGPGTGPNKDRLNKPEFVHYGGNTTLNDAGSIAVNEPGSSIVSTALNFAANRLFSACNGTSYAAPAVARVAADIAHIYPDASANLIRVMLAIGAVEPPPPLATQTEPRRRAYYGYGKPTVERAVSSGRRRATMTYEGSMPIDDVSIHPVPIPRAFRLGNGHRRTISLTLAFDPPVRHTRREYLAANMQLDLYRQITLDDLQLILARQQRDTKVPAIKGRRHPDLVPGPNSFRSSTLQRRSWSATNSFVDDDEIFYAVVTHTATTWARDDPEYPSQSYALAVTLEDEHLERADLHQLLSQETRLPARVRLRR